jgi:hypothetical protein
MNQRFSPTVFSVVFLSVYAAVYALKRPLFTYFPVEGVFRWGKAAGQYPMLWYGMVTAAAAPAALAASLVPEPRPSRLRDALPWLLAAAMLALVAAREAGPLLR